MGGCLKGCCLSEAGLRCHSVLTLCGFAYFALMFLIFQRQQLFFQFEIKDSEGARWACLFTALIFLLWFFVALIQIMKIEANQRGVSSKNKVSLAEVKEFLRKPQVSQDRQESEKLLIEQ